jgi:hypothetical protein
MIEVKERPAGITPWAERAPFLREIDKSVCSLVAAMAVHDAALDDAVKGMELARYRFHLPAILDALRVAAADCEYGARAKRYKTALDALSGREDAT